MSTDPWTTFLQLLESLIVPDWNDLIVLLPLLLVLGVVGPILSLVALMRVRYLVGRRRGRVRSMAAEPVSAPVGADGRPMFPPNVPFCEEHAVIYPPGARSCELDGGELTVRCPVDDASRPASQQLCRACGTKYVLGAATTAMTIRRSGSPPEGGAAVA